MNGIGRDDWKTLTHLVIKGKERLWRMLCCRSCCPARGGEDMRLSGNQHLLYGPWNTKEKQIPLKTSLALQVEKRMRWMFPVYKSPPNGQQSCRLYPNRTPQPKSHQLGNGIKRLSMSVVKRFDSAVLTPRRPPHRHYNGKDAACGVQKMRHQ